MSRLRALRDAIARYARRDPAGWDTGLSPAGARLALEAACEDTLAGLPPRPRGHPPRRLVIWCAGNVFTAPLPWTAIFAALGSEVVLKSPAGGHAPLAALAEELAAFRVSAHDLRPGPARALLSGADAVLGFGSDPAMAALDGLLGPGVRRSLHGHRVSVAVVGPDPGLAGSLALDLVLHDGQGCMSPAAIYVLGDPLPLARALRDALAEAARRWPPGPLRAEDGPAWRARAGLARVRGRLLAGERHAVAVLPPRSPLLPVLPRFAVVHGVTDLAAALHCLAGLPGSSCATDLGPEAERRIREAGFPRICAPGRLQRPPADGTHEGLDVVAHLSSPAPEGAGQAVGSSSPSGA